MIARRFLGAIAGAATILMVQIGGAAADDGIVEGTVSLADPVRRGEPPVRNRGFVRRQKNPLKPPRAMDPLPYVIVVLEGGPVDDADRQPPREPVRYTIIGESFASPVLPVVTGSSVELKNDTTDSPRIHAPSKPELIAGDPINPKGARVVKKLDLRYQALELRDHDSAHLQGWIVGFPHPYVARVDDAGRFEIKGVPPGQWKVRVWYRDGWLVGASDSITVIGGRSVPLKLTLPVELKVQAPAP